MPTALFHHPEVGHLAINNGLDDIQWAYNLNTATFPTYGGEVIQILSVFIDSISMQGTLSTYRQLEAVYGYWGRYMQAATQGVNPNAGSVGKTSFNLQPMVFTYPERNWHFKIYPLTAPQFYYGADVVAPQWQLQAHIIDDSPDLDLIKNGIKTLITTRMVNGADDGSPGSLSFDISGDISPDQGNPDTDPFQTYDGNMGQAQKFLSQMPDYYNSLLASYTGKDVSGLGSGPATTPSANNNQNTKTIRNQPSAGAKANQKRLG